MSTVLTPIDRFVGSYEFLSNFYKHTIYVPFLHEGEPFERSVPTLEHAYQAAKCEASDKDTIDLILSQVTPGKAKIAAKSIKYRPNWYNERDGVMERLLAIKFAKHTEMAAKLFQTHPRELIEGNKHGDVYWGKCGGKGHNKLGIMLVARRKYLLPFFRMGK